MRFFEKGKNNNFLDNAKTKGLLFALILTVSILIPLSNIQPASAATQLSLKWTGNIAGGGEALLTADVLSNYPGEEIFHAGGSESTPSNPSNGRVTCLNGRTGAQIWARSITNVGDTCQIHMVDLDNNGDLEIVVPLQNPAGIYILHAEDGSVMFSDTTLGGGRIDSSPVSGDVDGDGYPNLYVGVMAYEKNPTTGKIIHYEWNPTTSRIVERGQVQVWHPCAGGLSLCDTDNDGTTELYMNERDVYFGDGAWGRGTVSFWAENLTVRWQLYGWGASSNIPMLADVNRDGIVDVVTTDLSRSVCVLNSTDGRPLINDLGIVLSGSISERRNHYQSSIYDIDGDGNLEILSGDGFEANYDNVTVFDLWSWKLDASINTTLVGGRSWKGPTVGEITGDGVMDIIVTTFDHLNNTNNGTVQVYDRNYNLIHVNTGLRHRAIDSVVQDVDRNDDGLNELLILTQGGVVYCFDTPGIAANPRARSEIQFYSENRNGASENIPYERPWPDVSPISPAKGAVNVSTSLSQLSFRLNHPYGQTMNYTVTTTPNIGSGSGTNVGNGIRTVAISGLSPSTTYRWQVTATDQSGHTTTQNYWFITAPYITNTDPTHGTPTLSGNSVQDNLSCYNQSTADINGDKVTNIYNWYKNGQSITSLNMPFDIQPDADLVYSGLAATQDYSGRNNNGAIFGATWVPDGVVGGAFYFDGNDFITVNSSSSLGGSQSSPWSQMSIEFWIKMPTAGSTERLIWKPDRYDTRTVNSYRVDVRNNNGQQLELTWYICSGNNTYSIQYNQLTAVTSWHHVACTYKSGAGLKIYVDGAQRAINSSSAITGNINVTSGPLQIAFNGGRDFEGYLDEVRVYQTELTTTMVNQRYIETQNGLTSSSTIPKEDLTVGDQWRCRVTPNDGKADGTSRDSSTVTIVQGPTTQYRLTINVQGDGSTNPAVGSYQYASGTPVQVTANAGANYQFDHWLLNGTNYGNSNPCTVTMNANYILTAVFTEMPLPPTIQDCLVVRGTDNNLYYRTYDGSTWNGWQVIPGQTFYEPAAAIYNGKLHVAIIGPMYNAIYWGNVDLTTGEFSGWTWIQGASDSTPALTATDEGLCLVVRGTDSNLYYCTYDGVAWNSSWQVIPGQTNYEPAAAFFDGKLQVAIVGAQYNAIYWGSINLATGEFSDWTWIQGASDSTPALATSESKLCLVVRGTDNLLYYRTYDGSNWTPNWSTIPGETLYEPAAVGVGNRLDIAIVGMQYNAIYYGSVDLSSGEFSEWTWIPGASDSTPALA
jgi:hypothetical protein